MHLPQNQAFTIPVRLCVVLSLFLGVISTSAALAKDLSPQQLPTVSGVTIQPANNSIFVSWNTVAGADNYTVRWGTNGQYNHYSNDHSTADNPTTNTYTITGLKNNTKYNVSVAARNSKKLLLPGSYSAPVYTTPNLLTLPIVSGVALNPTGSTIFVSWNTVAGADNYTVRWGTNGQYNHYSNDHSTADNPTTNTYTITGLKNNTKYNVSVAARNSKKLLLPGAYSAPVYTTTTVTIPSTTSTTTLAPSTTRPTTTSTAPVNIGSGSFIENFTGHTLDEKSWKAYYNNYGSGNNELQCSTPNNILISDGTLKITAKSESIACKNYGTYKYTSGFLGSREASKYYPLFGTFEMRAKLPHGHATWPAFWLRHRNGSTATNGAEIDIMEYFHAQVPGKTTSTLHLAGKSNVFKKTSFFENPTRTPGWHTWSVSISPATNGVKFQFLLDGKDAGSYLDTNSSKWATSAPADATWDIAVNMAVGGNWNGTPGKPIGLLGNGTCAQGGTAPNNCSTNNILQSSFPATYEVDYVSYKPL